MSTPKDENKPENTTEPSREFIIGAALLMSLVALSIDSMLPALGQIAEKLHAPSANDRQMVLIFLFLGLSVGQIIYGPLSDSIGRKRAMYIGLGFFMIGSVLSAMADNFDHLLVGRLLEGFGAAGPRIVIVAMIRDLYSGRVMARVMSLVMSFFILVPVFAPMIGQGILLFFNWRMIFVLLMVLAMLAFMWLKFRQAETVHPQDRKKLSLGRITHAMVQVLTTRGSLGYLLCTGFVFSSFVAFLATAQQVFVDLYGTGEAFPFYFAVFAASLGVASYVNSRLVMKYGMRALSIRAICGAFFVATIFLLVCLFTAGKPPLYLVTPFFILLFFFTGILFGNLNALAMEEMGHIAGTASAVIGSLATLISLSFGAVIGHLYDHSITPVISGFVICNLLTLIAMLWAERGWPRVSFDPKK